jgi:predicted CxxxxCH...CXXCH cytochrome family protein
MKRRNSRMAAKKAVLVASVCLAFTGCLDVHSDTVDAGGDDCTLCHALDDITSGAHVVHLSDAGQWGGVGLTCADCHVIPTDWFVEGHLNASVDVIFADGGLASTGGAEPYFDGASCYSVYCHGGTLTGGENQAPKWNATTHVTCGDCHGIPPTEPHPAEAGCPTCHSAAYVDGGLDLEAHLNGIVDFAAVDGGM